jgi:hypothetical protein
LAERKRSRRRLSLVSWAEPGPFGVSWESTWREDGSGRMLTSNLIPFAVNQRTLASVNG